MRSILSVIGTVLTTCALLSASPASAAPGDMDPSFGSGFGKVMTAIGMSNDYGRAIALQPDGKIVVAGACYNGSNYDFCLARYQANGAVDSGFGTSGKVISAIG